MIGGQVSIYANKFKSHIFDLISRYMIVRDMGGLRFAASPQRLSSSASPLPFAILALILYLPRSCVIITQSIQCERIQTKNPVLLMILAGLISPVDSASRGHFLHYRYHPYSLGSSCVVVPYSSIGQWTIGNTTYSNHKAKYFDSIFNGYLASFVSDLWLQFVPALSDYQLVCQ